MFRVAAIEYVQIDRFRGSVAKSGVQRRALVGREGICGHWDPTGGGPASIVNKVVAEETVFRNIQPFSCGIVSPTYLYWRTIVLSVLTSVYHQTVFSEKFALPAHPAVLKWAF